MITMVKVVYNYVALNLKECYTVVYGKNKMVKIAESEFSSGTITLKREVMEVTAHCRVQT